MADLLQVENVTAGYGDAVVLRDLCVSVGQGQSLAVLGRNGVGKTTLLETIMGNARVARGRIVFDGRDLTHWPPHHRVRAGIGWVPQEREVFPSLTVMENLMVVARPGPWDVRRIFSLFPRLSERAGNYGNQLSGGEQQMLAIGRALMTNPRLLLLDEPMEGLAPIIVAELAAAINVMREQDGLPSIIVEQRPVVALSMARQVAILERGAVVHHGPSSELAADAELLARLLGIGSRQRSPRLALVKASKDSTVLDGAGREAGEHGQPDDPPQGRMAR